MIGFSLCIICLIDQLFYVEFFSLKLYVRALVFKLEHSKEFCRELAKTLIYLFVFGDSDSVGLGWGLRHISHVL